MRQDCYGRFIAKCGYQHISHFGLEVIEIRYGGLMARLESLIDYIDDFISGDIDTIPEI